MKQQIRLNESQLRKVVKESVINILNEDVQYSMQMEYLSGLKRQQQALDVTVDNLMRWAKWFQSTVPQTLQQFSQQLQSQNGQRQNNNQQQLQSQNNTNNSMQQNQQNNSQQQVQPQNRQQ